MALIVPRVAFPPATPFTDQVNAGVEPVWAFAVNCCVLSPASVAVAGVTVRAKFCGPPLGIMASAHPPRNTTKMDTRISDERFTAGPPFSFAAFFAADGYTRLAFR